VAGSGITGNKLEHTKIFDGVELLGACSKPFRCLWRCHHFCERAWLLRIRDINIRGKAPFKAFAIKLFQNVGSLGIREILCGSVSNFNKFGKVGWVNRWR